MRNDFKVSAIGQSQFIDGCHTLQVLPDYREGLSGLSAFSHAIALWWAHDVDAAEHRRRLSVKTPYTASPDDFGVFATRSPARPNPIGVSVFAIHAIDLDEGLISTPFIDTMPGTPILDIKPYFPASDRVAHARIPGHFGHWPASLEASAEFDWSGEFTR